MNKTINPDAFKSIDSKNFIDLSLILDDISENLSNIRSPLKKVSNICDYQSAPHKIVHGRMVVPGLVLEEEVTVLKSRLLELQNQIKSLHGFSNKIRPVIFKLDEILIKSSKKE